MSKFFKKPINKIKALCTATSVTTVITTTTPMLLAAGPSSVKYLAEILNVIFDIFLYIGILLFGWSIGMLVLSFKNEDADSKSRAIMLLITSIVLIGFKTAVSPLMTSLGVPTT